MFLNIVVISIVVLTVVSILSMFISINTKLNRRKQLDKTFQNLLDHLISRHLSIIKGHDALYKKLEDINCSNDSIYTKLSDLERLSDKLDKLDQYRLNAIAYNESEEYKLFELDVNQFDKLGVPVITFKRNKKSYNFILDTGADKNFFNVNVFKSFGLEKKDTGEDVTTGNGIVTTVESAKINFKFVNKLFNEEFLLMDLDVPFNTIKEREGVEIHGILGSKFFAKYNWVLDFENIVVWMKNS